MRGCVIFLNKIPFTRDGSEHKRMGDGRWMAKLVARHLSGFESRHLLNSKWRHAKEWPNTLKPSKQKINLGFWRTGMMDTWIYRAGRVLSFFSSRRNWDYPNPSPAGECAPPPLVLGGRGTLAGERGVGRVRRGDIHCGTLYIYVLCACITDIAPKSKTSTGIMFFLKKIHL
jgi:hypothetical protein